jgi:hypothetical protein
VTVPFGMGKIGQNLPELQSFASGILNSKNLNTCNEVLLF